MSGPTLLQSTSNFSTTNGPSFSVSFQKPCTPGSTIIPAWIGGGQTFAPSISDPSNGSYAKDKWYHGPNVDALIYSVQNLANTALTVTVTYPGTSTVHYMALQEWMGLAPSPFDQTGPASSASPGTSASATTPATVQASEIAVALLFTNFGFGVVTPGAGFTLDQQKGGKFATEYALINGIGPVTAGFSWTTGELWTLLVNTYKAAAPGGNAILLPRRRRRVRNITQTISRH